MPIFSVGYNRQIKMGDRYLSVWRGHEAGKVEVPVYFWISKKEDLGPTKEKFALLGVRLV